MRLPEWAMQIFGLDEGGLHTAKLICAVVLIVLYIFMTRRNHVGGMLALPIFFAALLEDMGFYATAPFFVIGVMFLMGERRPQWMVVISEIPCSDWIWLTAAI